MVTMYSDPESLVHYWPRSATGADSVAVIPRHLHRRVQMICSATAIVRHEDPSPGPEQLRDALEMLLVVNRPLSPSPLNWGYVPTALGVVGGRVLC